MISKGVFCRLDVTELLRGLEGDAWHALTSRRDTSSICLPLLETKLEVVVFPIGQLLIGALALRMRKLPHPQTSIIVQHGKLRDSNVCACSKLHVPDLSPTRRRFGSRVI